jgi:Tfp pilus assembly protein PilV
MRIIGKGNSMVECLVALAIMTFGLLGFAELGLQRIGQIKTASQQNMLIGIARDTVVLRAAGADDNQPIGYATRISTNNAANLNQLVVSATASGPTGAGNSITLPAGINAAAD